MVEQKYIYVAFVRSNTAAGAIIRKITGWSYSHVSVSLNRKTGKFYAFSRLNCGSPFWAGFTQEYRSNYSLLKDKPVEITYYKIPVTVEELKKVKAFIYMLSRDKEYIFNYPSMVTTTILHGFRMYKSYNCVTFVSKILSFLNSVELKKKYYKYDLMELEEAVSSFRDGSETVCINCLESPNPFFHKMGFRSCRREEFGLVTECCYRLLFGRSSKKYRSRDCANIRIKRESSDTFDVLASDYDHSLTGHNPRKNYRMIMRSLQLRDNDVLLDVGCGTGEILTGISAKYPKARLYGLDISRKMLQVAGKKNSDGRITYICGDAEKLPFRDNMFDVLVTSESFHHYPNPQQALREFARVLKPGGRLLLCDMYRPAGVRHFMNFMFHFTRTGDVKIYTVPEITALLRQNGFAVTSKEQHYSGFLCVALNTKKADGDR